MRKIMPALAAMLALGATWGVGIATAQGDGESVDVSTVSEAKVDAMLKAGWYGDPTDDAERLYSPDTCRVVAISDVPEHARKAAALILIDQGFKGNPNDGREALYAPAC